MGLALDQFLRGLRSEHIQDALLNSPPDNLEEAEKMAKRLEAALAARKRICSKKQPPVHSRERTTCGQEEDSTLAQENISAHTSYSYSDDLTCAVWRNTELLENLLLQLTPSKPGIRLTSPEERFRVRRGRRRPIVCWWCK